MVPWYFLSGIYFVQRRNVESRCGWAFCKPSDSKTGNSVAECQLILSHAWGWRVSSSSPLVRDELVNRVVPLPTICIANYNSGCVDGQGVCSGKS